MRKVTFVMGPPASGKSYFITHHFAGKDVDVLDIYDYQLQAFEEAGYKLKISSGIPRGIAFRCLFKANEMQIRDIIKKLKSGRDVVVEHTFYMAKSRISYVDAIRKKINAAFEVFVIHPSDELWRENLQKKHLESLERNKNKLSEQEFPNPAEGFDAIYEVINDVIIQRDDPPDVSIREKALEELAWEDRIIHRRKGIFGILKKNRVRIG